MSGRVPAPPVWSFGDPVEQLAECIGRGGILGIPTESSYGLAADPNNREGVEAVFRVKGRPASKPLPVVVGGLDGVATLGAELGPGLESRLRALWPAPLTVVLAIRHPVAASVGRTSLAFRVPRHERLRKLLNSLGSGLTATSANVSGERAIVAPGELSGLLAGVDAMVVDGGVLGGGPPSTVVRPEGVGWCVLREGAFPLDRLGGPVTRPVDGSVDGSAGGSAGGPAGPVGGPAPGGTR